MLKSAGPRLDRRRAVGEGFVQIDLGLLGRQSGRIAEALAVMAAVIEQQLRQGFSKLTSRRSFV